MSTDAVTTWIDLALLHERLAGNEALIEETLQGFTQNTPELMQTIIDAVEAQDQPALAQALKNYKEVALSAAASPLVETIFYWETWLSPQMAIQQKWLTRMQRQHTDTLAWIANRTA